MAAWANLYSALKSHFVAVEDDDDRGVNETRGLACELVAWRFVTHFPQNNAIDYLCEALPVVAKGSPRPSIDSTAAICTPGESTPLLDDDARPWGDGSGHHDDDGDDDCVSFAHIFSGQSALEIAAISDAKEFMSQKAIQRIISGIFWGDIVFWETLSTHASNTKKARVYNKQRSDPFCRLRVPVYLKTFETLFFLAFLAFYYTVLGQKPYKDIYASEILLYVWIASFAYNGEFRRKRGAGGHDARLLTAVSSELGEFFDAGSTLYAKDFWMTWDLGIIFTGAAFFCLRMIGLAKEDHKITDIAFDVLSVEALFLVPRWVSRLLASSTLACRVTLTTGL